VTPAGTAAASSSLHVVSAVSGLQAVLLPGGRMPACLTSIIRCLL
jgi:hypothetical protein